ncbi:class I SAM-dependent methyltransferase [Billgrantia sulfidoxydans]|uniref:Class I SAM-dependent methyltransferase n=1 Tax=Billgrantia sulfidoxydans TaxID=2733484 RepID=A0ABX7W4D1_9GAMM|nr:class I SAM-dependent methyltransferase [Halomonas sulfidoxydans]QTP55253.1 class I SAM-dependent methyltransferase [Halomonas sulfidoxydans]
MNVTRKGFYKAFEDKFRGDREEIKSRLEVYLPFVEALKESVPDVTGLDLGCGRGEWLELLRDSGVVAQGVDLDEDMLAACHECGLHVNKADALSCISDMDDESVTIISAFHVIEHIPFNDLQSLLKESFRVLKPGGLLILETPNSENIVVGTSRFYLDPTHQRPIPAQLLSFISEYLGFQRVKTLYLQEPEFLFEKEQIRLYDVLSGVSPDYAVVAQKDGEEKLLSRMSVLFDREYGFSLEKLSNKYDEYINFQLKQSEARAEKAEEEVSELLISRSWRITAPLRWLQQQLRLLRNYGLKARLKVGGDKISYKCKAVVRKCLDPNDIVRHKIIVVADRLGFYPVLRSIYRRFIKNTSKGVSSGCYGGLLNPNSLEELPPRAKQLYFEFKSSSSQQQESH